MYISHHRVRRGHHPDVRPDIGDMHHVLEAAGSVARMDTGFDLIGTIAQLRLEVLNGEVHSPNRLYLCSRARQINLNHPPLRPYEVAGQRKRQYVES